jgi:putative spermidine/putrescine transport system substrate-binding protein
MTNRRFTRASRRSVLKGISAGAAAGLLGPARFAGAQQVVVKVTHYGGPYAILRDLIAKPFADAKLGEVQYEVELSTTALAKLQAQVNDPPFDVAMMPRSVALRAANAGLTAPIARDDLPNLKGASDGTFLEPNVGAAFVHDALDLMYNTKQAKGPVTKWSDMWRPEFAGKVALPGVPLTLGVYVLVAMAREMGGNEKDDKAINEAFKKLADLRKSVRVFFTDPVQATQLMDRGEIAIAPQFSIRIANLMKANAEIGRATPKGNAPAIPYDLVIAKNSKNIPLAKTYINFTMSDEVQSRVATSLLATPVSKKAEIPADAQRFVIKSADELYIGDEAYLASKSAQWLDRWNREVQS